MCEMFHENENCHGERMVLECLSCEFNITAPSRLYILAAVDFVFWLTFIFGRVSLTFVAVLLKSP